MFTTTLALLGVLLTGDFPGTDVAGIEEDHPAVIIALDIHDNIA